MSRGQKTSPEKIYEIITSYAITHSYKQTSRDTGIAVSTVKKIVDEHKCDPEFEKICNEKKSEFAESASRLIDKGMLILERRFDRALLQEHELDAIISEIHEATLTQDEKNKIIAKLKALQMHDIKALTTAIGTLFDKRALAEGTATDNVTVNVKLPEGIEEYAG